LPLWIINANNNSRKRAKKIAQKISVLSISRNMIPLLFWGRRATVLALYYGKALKLARF